MTDFGSWLRCLADLGYEMSFAENGGEDRIVAFPRYSAGFMMLV